MAGTNFLSAVTSTLNAELIDENGLIRTGNCVGVPPTTANLFVHGALITRTDSGTGNKALYENVGSSASPSWNLVGDVTAGEITLALNNVLQGNSSGVAEAVTSITLPKEGSRTISVATSTSADTVGGSMSVVGAAGFGTGNGGAFYGIGGQGGATGAGGVAYLTGGAGGATSGAGGNVLVTGGAATAGNANGGDVIITAGAKSGTGKPGAIYLRSTLCISQSSPTAKTTSTTLTAQELGAGIITVNQGGGSTSALQLPDGTALDTAFSNFTTNDAFDFSVINISTVAAEDASITVNTGVTIVGNADIASNAAATDKSSGRFRLRKTGTATWTAYRIA
jgi:hypothetical protein